MSLPNRSCLAIHFTFNLLLTFWIAVAQGQGVDAHIYSGRNFEVFQRIESGSDLSFNWERQGPDGEVPQDNFSIRWMGQLLPPETGTFQFQANFDDGYRLWVADQLIINAWTGGPSIITGEVNLTAGRLTPIMIEFFEAGGIARSLLQWRHTSSEEGFSSIPLSFLSAPDPDQGVARVGLVVRDPRALEGNDPARYTVFRLGDLSEELVVFLSYEGDAEEGSDYINPRREVTIPAHQSSIDIDLYRVDNMQARGLRTLTVSIAPQDDYLLLRDAEIQLLLLDDERDMLSNEYTFAGEVFQAPSGGLVILKLSQGEQEFFLTQVGDGPFSSPLLPEGEYQFEVWSEQDGDRVRGEDEPQAELSIDGTSWSEFLSLTLPPDQLSIIVRFPSEEMTGGMAGEPAGDPAGESAGEPAGEPAGESAGEPAGESAGESAGDGNEAGEPNPAESASVSSTDQGCQTSAKKRSVSWLFIFIALGLYLNRKRWAA